MNDKPTAKYGRLSGYIDTAQGIKVQLENVVHPILGEQPLVTTSVVEKIYHDEAGALCIVTRNTFYTDAA